MYLERFVEKVQYRSCWSGRISVEKKRIKIGQNWVDLSFDSCNVIYQWSKIIFSHLQPILTRLNILSSNFLPNLRSYCWAYLSQKTKEFLISSLLSTAIENHMAEFCFLTRFHLHLHHFVRALVIIQTALDGQVNWSAQRYQVGLRFVSNRFWTFRLLFLITVFARITSAFVIRAFRFVSLLSKDFFFDGLIFFLIRLIFRIKFENI